MNIIVISHRRSGTHLTIDSIVNNFSVFKNIDFITLEQFLNSNEASFFEKIKSNNNIIKTHILPDFSLYNINEKNAERLTDFFKNSLKIYVYRNSLDVMVSLFHYMQNYKPEFKHIKFSDFIKTFHDFEKTPNKFNRIDFWSHHIKSWQKSAYSDNILFVKYEDWISDYSLTLNKISDFINIKSDDKINDIRIKNTVDSRFLNKYWFSLKKNFNKIFKKQKITSVSHRKGKINDYVNYFTEKDYRNISQDVWQLMKQLKYKTH